MQYQPGQHLIKAGDEGDCAFIIGEGRVAIQAKDTDGHVQFLRYAGRNEILGEMALLIGGKRTADVVAQEKVDAIKITAGLFEKIIARSNSLGEAVSELLIERLLTLDEASRRIGNYQIDDKLGMAAMGVVFRGFHMRLNRPVAIKFLFHHLALQKECKEIFQRETELLSSLAHPNIVGVHDAGTAFRTLYLVMDLIEGTTLNNILKEEQKLSPIKTRRFLVPLLDALAAASERGIVHRDVKPPNIIIDVSGRAMLMDFGLAMFQTSPQEEDLYGTVEYCSPEQIEGGAIDGRSDIYSLGITAYEMLTGTVPFKAADAYDVINMHMTRTVPDVRTKIPDCPADLAYFIHRATRRDPKERFADAREAQRSLLGDSPVATRKRRRISIEFDADREAEVEKLWSKFYDKLAGIKGVQIEEGTGADAGQA